MKRLLTALLLAAMLPGALIAKKTASPAGITVMSYNIRMGQAKDGSNSWQYRYPASAMMLSDQAPDVMGVQEAFDYQVKYLKEFVPGYKCIGVGREDGKSKGEHMSIFYNKKKIALLKWGTYWLSDTPDTPSQGWDAACIRTATWALMKDKSSGKKFFMVNTHLDHVGREARAKGLSLIMDRIAAMNQDGLPLVVTGDFNMKLADPSMAPIRERMTNARDSAVITDDKASFNGWGKSLEGKSGKDAIDFIWYTGFSSCTQFETVTKPYMERTFISDHFPVKANLVF